MATQAEIDDIKRREQALIQKRNELADQLESAEEQLEKDLRTIRLLDGKTAADGLTPRGAELLAEAKERAPRLQQQISNLEVDLAPLRSEINDLASQRVRLEKQLAAVTPEPPPAQSASQQVETQTNQTPQPLSTANQPTVSDDTGTEAPVKPLEESQAITTASNSGQPLRPPSAGASAEGAAGEAEAASAVLTQGQGAKDDAQDTATPAAAVNATETVEPNIQPRPNILDEFASYTYSASVYLLTTEQYTQLLRTKTKSVDGYNLLFQSAGAPNNRGGVRQPLPAVNAGFGPGVSEFGNDAAPVAPPDGGRNPFFDNDFYIDSITLETLPLGKGTNAVHNASSLKFTLVEPNGITMLDRLYDAVANSEPKSATGRVNYSAVTYLMVIRFYGYDSMGQPVQIRSRRFDAEGVSDQSAVIEKFIPFRVNNINWSVSSKMVTYEWECTPVGQQIAGFTARGTIPYDLQLTETTVGKLLSGTSTFSNQTAPPSNPGASTTPTSSDPRQRRSQVRLSASQASAGVTPAAPAKANAAPTDKKTLVQGLADAMNQFQQDLVKRGIYTYADIYEIEFAGPGSEKIRDAVLASAGQNPIAQTASGKAPTQDPGSLRPSTNSVDKTTKNFSITAGQQLLQVIDLVVRNSSYIYDQALVIVDKDGTVKPNPNSRNQPVKWFTITMQAERISPDLDPKRNDYAYRIKYVISPFVVKNLDSVYFPRPQFSGVHKSYPYWFTGQNTAVLDYTEKLNAMYHLTISGEVPGDTNAARTREFYTSSLADIIKYSYAPRSSESSSGAQGKTNELAANAAESLLSPSDMGEATVKIIGDPDWIQQGSIFRGVNDLTFAAQTYNTGFMPDGSVSFDSQDVLFEIVWKRPNDYDIFTGKADPYGRSAAKYNNYSAEQSRVYHCKRVVSEFRQGRFEQTLHGALYLFPKPDQTNVANPAAAAAANQDIDNGRRPAPVVLQANQTSQTAARLGLNLTPEAAAASRQAFAQVDPRRLDIGDGGTAAIAGAQALAATMKPNPPAAGVNNGVQGSSLPQAIDQATVPTVTLFSQPKPPTSGSAPVQSVVFRPPGSLPSADPRVGRLTNTQVQDLVNQQRSNVNTSPASATNAANQRGVIEP
jgi:hypothetical protein